MVSHVVHRLLAAIRELDCVGSLDVLAIGVLVVAEVCAGVVVFDSVGIVVWDLFLLVYRLRMVGV